MKRGIAPSGEPRHLPLHPALTQGLFDYCSLNLQFPPAPPALPDSQSQGKMVHSLTPSFIWCLPLEGQHAPHLLTAVAPGPAQCLAHCLLNEHLNEELEMAVVMPFAQLSASPSARKPQESTE